jgi:hypothetical protein
MAGQESNGKGMWPMDTTRRRRCPSTMRPKARSPLTQDQARRSKRRKRSASRRSSTARATHLHPRRLHKRTTLLLSSKKWLKIHSTALLLIIHPFLVPPMPNCFRFLLASLLTLMGRIICGGAIKCVAIFSCSTLVFGIL